MKSLEDQADEKSGAMEDHYPVDLHAEPQMGDVDVALLERFLKMLADSSHPADSDDDTSWKCWRTVHTLQTATTTLLEDVGGQFTACRQRRRHFLEMLEDSSHAPDSDDDASWRCWRTVHTLQTATMTLHGDVGGQFTPCRQRRRLRRSVDTTQRRLTAAKYFCWLAVDTHL